MEPAFIVVSSLPQGIEQLAQLAIAEDFAMVRRLVDNYVSGSNTFSKQGECRCAAHGADREPWRKTLRYFSVVHGVADCSRILRTAELRTRPGSLEGQP
jgi:hypothetical protein